MPCSQVFAHRDAYEQVVSKTEEKLQRARLDYKRAYAALLTNDGGGGSEQELKRAYLESHNAYILQLRATNAITERYQFHCLPGLLGEIAEVYEELCGLACKCVAGISEAAGERAGEQTKRYQAVAKEAQAVMPSNDLQVCSRFPEGFLGTFDSERTRETTVERFDRPNTPISRSEDETRNLNTRPAAK